MDTNLIATLSFLGNLVMGAGFIWVYMRKGAGAASSEVIKIYQLRDEEQKQTIADNQLKFDAINKELGRLNGINEEQAKKLEEYTKIFQYRDPKLQQILERIESYLQTLTQQSNINQTRNEAIDKDTQEENGKVLRKDE